MAEEPARIWDELADHWDAKQGEHGTDVHRVLDAPAIMRLLALERGERLLDLGCGNGTFAREAARAGAIVVATDVSPAMIERAYSYEVPPGCEIAFKVVDATDETAVRNLGEASFDAVVCSMALMDMPDLAGVMRGAAAVLRNGGRFVFSILHPDAEATSPWFLWRDVPPILVARLTLRGGP